MFPFAFYLFYLKFISSVLSYFFNANYANLRSAIKDTQIAKSNNSAILKPKTNRDDVSENRRSLSPRCLRDVSTWRDYCSLFLDFARFQVRTWVIFHFALSHVASSSCPRSKPAEEKTKRKRNLTREWQDCNAIHWQRLPTHTSVCLCTGAFGCVVTAFANLYALL